MSRQIDITPDGSPVLSGVVDAVHTLTSSNDPGKVKIDPDTGVMAVNPFNYGTSEVSTGEKWIDGTEIFRQSIVYTRSAGGTAGQIAGLFDLPSDKYLPVRLEGIYTPDSYGFDFTPIGMEFAANGTTGDKWYNTGNGSIKVIFPAVNIYTMRVIAHVWYVKL
jgi:hypothetical protein